MRVVFLGSPPFATPIFGALCASRFAPVGLVTQPDRASGRGRTPQLSPLVEAARARGLPLLQPESTRSPDFVAALRALRPELLFVASYGEILDETLLALAPLGALNLHGSLLPRWRGASPVQQAILHGDERTGVCVQKMVRELDAGDLLCQRELLLHGDETGGALAARLAELGAELALEALELIASGQARFSPQDPARVTRCRKLKREHARIDWTRDALELERLVRAMHPWPMAHARLALAGEVSIASARLRAESIGTPGQLLERGPRLLVACGRGALELLELQSPGKRLLAAEEWLRGARPAAEEHFTRETRS